MKDLLNTLNEFRTLLFLSEMAVMTPDQHNFGVDVRFHIMKEHEGYKLRHGPRIKVYNKFEMQNFSISISDQPKVIGNWKGMINKKELNNLIECVIKYKIALLNYWYDITYQKYDLIDDIQSIKEGNEIEKRY